VTKPVRHKSCLRSLLQAVGTNAAPLEAGRVTDLDPSGSLHLSEYYTARACWPGWGLSSFLAPA